MFVKFTDEYVFGDKFLMGKVFYLPSEVVGGGGETNSTIFKCFSSNLKYKKNRQCILIKLRYYFFQKFYNFIKGTVFSKYMKDYGENIA